jgi:hypothetical protein
VILYGSVERAFYEGIEMMPVSGCLEKTEKRYWGSEEAVGWQFRRK